MTAWYGTRRLCCMKMLQQGACGHWEALLRQQGGCPHSELRQDLPARPSSTLLLIWLCTMSKSTARPRP